MSAKRIILLIIAAFAAFSASAQARLVFEPDTWDFGTIRESDGRVSHTFTGVNRGDKPLVILDVVTSCGCTVPEFSRQPVTPGGKTQITVTYDPMNRPGTFTHGLGLHVTGIGDGWAEGELTAGDGMLNPLGIVHGGVYAAMMDHVAGTAACSRGSTCRTVNYDLHYLAPAQPGLLRCRAESVRMGQQIVVMQVWVEDAQGVRCAEGCYTFRCKPAEHKD